MVRLGGRNGRGRGVTEVEQGLGLLGSASDLRLGGLGRRHGLRLGFGFRLGLGLHGRLILGQVSEVAQLRSSSLPSRQRRHARLLRGLGLLHLGDGAGHGGGGRGHHTTDHVAEGAQVGLQLARRRVRGLHHLPGGRDVRQLASLHSVAGTARRRRGGLRAAEETHAGLRSSRGSRGGSSGRRAHRLDRGELSLQALGLLTLDLHSLVVLDHGHNDLNLIAHCVVRTEEQPYLPGRAPFPDPSR